MRSLPITCTALLFSVTVATVNAAFASERDRAELFVRGFQSVCFDTDWLAENEAWSLRLLGFESIEGENVRRWYKLNDLYRASFLSSSSTEASRPACFFETRSVNPSLVRRVMEAWEYAGVSLADQIQDGDRVTMWNVEYRRHAGTVLLNEETSQDSTLVTLMLLGDKM